MLRYCFLLLLVLSAHSYVPCGKTVSAVKSSRGRYSFLFAEGDQNGMGDKVDMQGRPGMKGYYRRPSRAIERGGGFFVPGLEGERIRFITAAALVIMFAVNRAGQVSAMQTSTQLVSEATGLMMALMLFLQGAAELFGLDGLEENTYNDNAQARGKSLSEQTVSSYLSVIQSSTTTTSDAASVPILEQLASIVAQTCVY